MRKARFVLILFGLIFILVSLNTVVFADVVVITNDSVADNLDHENIKKIFLGKKKYWDNGQAIIFFVSTDSSAHQEFVEKYLNKSVNQFNNYWKRLLFTGQGVLPRQASEKELVELIKKTKGAIGYLPASMAPQGAKVITPE